MPFKSKKQMKACFATNGFHGAIDCDEWAHATNMSSLKQQGGLNMRPKNCKSCGGKMQDGGFKIDPRLFQSQQDLNDPSLRPAYQEPAYQAPQMNRIQEGIAQGVLEAPRADSPDEQMTAQQWYDMRNGSPSQKKKKSPYDLLQRIGIGMQAARTGLGWLSGAVERGRQNQYDYAQQTALGQMNPMPVKDFQETYNNPYAQMGGNPFSHYAKYGGNLKTILKDYMKFSNNAQFDFGSGDDDLGRMQQGGTPQGSTRVNEHQVTYPGDTLTNNQLRVAKLQLQNDVPLLPKDKVFAGQYDQQGNPHDWMWYSGENLFRKGPANVQYYNLSAKDKAKLANMSGSAFPSSFVGALPAPEGYTNPAIAQQFSENGKKMKKGGYEIDRMIVVRKLIPDLLLNIGRMGHRYSKYQNGGLNLSGYGAQDDLVAFPRLINNIAKTKGISQDEAKALYAQWQSNPGAVQPLSQSIPMLMQSQGKTNYSISYPSPTGQGQVNKYYNTLDEWNSQMQGKQYSSQQISGDKSSASASIYGQLKQGGNWIPKHLRKGRCTPAPNPDCPVGSPQYNLAQTFKKHHGFHKKK